MLLWSGSLSQVQAISLNAVYFGSCQREVGVILRVNDSNLQLLTLKGTIKTISRFDITYLTYYPVGGIPIHKITNPEEVPLVTIKTLFNKKIVNLVQGWPVDFSENKISFLTTEGDETIIESNNIWAVEITQTSEPLEFVKEEIVPLHFLHPYPFSHCETEDSQNSIKRGQTVYPQQLLGDPLLIKKELDVLKEGHDRIEDYDRDQKFYPVPQVFSNDTTLGMWVNVGSRYGTSKFRSNNFTPVLISELSEGPFGYQRIFVTGVAPMLYSIHEEPQTQFYYRMKADYAHFSFMYDLSRLLIGEGKYKWDLGQLGTNDDRMTEIGHLGGGFDFGPYVIDLTLPDIQYAIRHEGLYFHSRLDMTRGALVYHNRFIKGELYFGEGFDKPEEIIITDRDSEGEQADKKEEQAKIFQFSTHIRVLRLNLHFNSITSYRPLYTMIIRTLNFSRENDDSGTEQFTYASTSITHALYLHYSWTDQLRAAGYVSLESHENEYGITELSDQSSNLFPKAGMSVSLSF